jgi:hypothetical protein
MADEPNDEVEQFIAGINAEELRREEMSERWRARVRADEAAKLAQKNKPLDQMTDAEFTAYKRSLGIG